MKKVVLAVIISAISVSMAQASTTVANIDQHAQLISGPMTPGYDHSKPDSLTIQGIDNKTYDLEGMSTDISKNATDTATVQQAQVKDSKSIADHEQRIQTLESNSNSNFANLDKKVDDNRKRASAGIAGVAAMANIPQVIQGQTLAIGAGVGTTDGENAMAVGFSARTSEHTIVKASVSDDSQQNFVVGGGVSYGW
ncbi:YadA C-terminal domain-containing protein [Kluyvera sichuanensis]|uniref:YadA C-terminal domain-containing protein n=1 Tax=Kluyvera sichuanensis TaxID=2725494 RepID=UPI0039F57736